MRPDTSDWRNDRSYDHLDKLPIEGLAWECLRRYVPYQDYFGSFTSADAQYRPLTEEEQMRWGLRFPCQAKPLRPGAACDVVAVSRSGRAHANPTTGISAFSLEFAHRHVRRRA